VPKTKASYTVEFKREVLAYQASTGKSQSEVAIHFGVTANSLRAWQRRAQVPLGAPEPGAASESPEAEVRRLRRENRELQLRCEILKKTVGIFSSPSASDTGRSNG
jgi:transposase